ncbi:MAG: hypothetical protein O2793_17605, partial [Proteobacteria bacterium]|nr:hypothetical protein [Pseudomonadota bacterium]
MSEEEKAEFEREHGDFIKEQVAKHHPNLVNNKALIAVLLDPSNAKLLKSTSQEESLAALKSPDLLEDETQFNAFLTALENDVNTLGGLKESVAHVHKEVEKYQKSLTKYPNVVLALVDKMGAIAKENPSA